MTARQINEKKLAALVALRDRVARRGGHPFPDEWRAIKSLARAARGSPWEEIELHPASDRVERVAPPCPAVTGGGVPCRCMRCGRLAGKLAATDRELIKALARLPDPRAARAAPKKRPSRGGGK